MARTKKSSGNKNNGATLGFEAKMWTAADIHLDNPLVGLERYKGPLFNNFDWGGERPADGSRRKYGVPPEDNVCFAWDQHLTYHIAPTGMARLVMADESNSYSMKGEKKHPFDFTVRSDTWR